MKRNWMIFGCAALLALGLSFGSFAGSITDTDGDGVPDSFDNCRLRDNGPLQATGACNGQEDANLDGYGQPCDFDYNNNGAADASDLTSMLGSLGNPAQTAQDNNCNGSPTPVISPVCSVHSARRSVRRVSPARAPRPAWLSK